MLVGTAGQRCTTLRRLILHESIYDGFVERLVKAYAQVDHDRVVIVRLKLFHF